MVMYTLKVISNFLLLHVHTVYAYQIIQLSISIVCVINHFSVCLYIQLAGKVATCIY